MSTQLPAENRPEGGSNSASPGGRPDVMAAEEQRVYVASQWQLMWWKFRRHRLALVGAMVILLLYGVAVLAEYVAPYGPEEIRTDSINQPPTRIHWIDDNGRFRWRPFVYGVKSERDPILLSLSFVEDTTRIYPIYLHVRGAPYEFWGLIQGDRHLFGLATDEARIFVSGADRNGRDMFTRIVYGSRLSLSIGLIGVAISFFLGVLLGGLSGYYGGALDTAIQRVIEFVRSIPTIPLWMALSAALPPNWPPVRIYFGITIILSLIGWTGLARVVRGRFLSLREEDFVMAARLCGSSELRIILRHMAPAFASHIIASLTLAIPGMILSETSLSFLGLGLRYPAISWGVLLQDAQNVRSVALAPWLLLPGAAVVVSVLALNFLGDGLRDAADPYSR